MQLGRYRAWKLCLIWSGRRRSTSKKCHGKSSEKTKPALLSTCCANSFNGIHEPRTVADFITNKTLLPVGTTRDWTEQPNHNKSWHETLATEVNVHARGKNCRLAIIKKLMCGWKLACAIAWETMILWWPYVNSYIPPWGVVVAIPHPREGYNYYKTCYLGNITVQERFEQHS